MMIQELLRSIRLPVLAVALGAMALPSLSYAQATAGPGRARQNRAVDRAQARPQPQRAQQIQQMLGQLDLSSDQKEKLQPILDESRQKVRDIMQNTTDPQQRRQKMQEAMVDSRKKINDILTPEQRTKLQELMREQRASAATQPAARAGQGGMIAQLEEAALGLNLTDEQKTQVKDLSKEYQDEVASILKNNAANGAQAGAGRNGLGQQLRPVLQEYQSRLTQLLTPEQTEQFNKKITELRLQQWNAGGAGGGRGQGFGAGTGAGAGRRAARGAGAAQ